MALTFYWRCESGTLDGTHDYSAGDTTATNNNTPNYTTGARLVGSTGNGLLTSGDSRAMFDAASIWTVSQGSIGFWVQTTDFSLDTDRKCFALTEATSNQCVRVHLTGAGSGSTDVTVYTNDGRTGQATIATSGVAMATGSKYFVTFQWNTATNSRRVAVYNSSLVLIDDTEDTSTSFTVDGTPSQIWVGNMGSWRGYQDNVFIGSAYTDAPIFVTNAAIESYTSYAVADTTAPVLTSPTGTQTGSSTATVGVTTDENNGTLYAVVTTSATQPSVAQVKAGQNNGGTAAAYASSQAISSTGAKTFSATVLAPGTTYYAHFVHTDTALNNSTVSSTSSFTTASAVTRIGTPSVIENESTYTAETGSNRLVVFVVGSYGSTLASTVATGLLFGSVPATPIRQRGLVAPTYAGISVFVVPESVIPSGAQAVSATFPTTPEVNSWIACLTLADADQLTFVASTADNAQNSSAAELSWTLGTTTDGGLGLCFVATSAAGGLTHSLTTVGGWSEFMDGPNSALSTYWAAERILTGASTTAGVTASAARSSALVALAVRRYSTPAAPTITDAGTELYFNAQTGIVITGTNFGLSQGVGSVKISPTNNVADGAAVTQTITAWSDTSITITSVKGLLSGGAPMYLFVTNNGAASNATGFSVAFVNDGSKRTMMLGLG